MGAVIIDADKIAHQVLESPDITPEIVQAFGPEVVEDGKVSRKALASVVFADRAGLERLNDMIHPRVIDRISDSVRSLLADGKTRAVVIDAPLLFETQLNNLCDVELFVETDRERRAERLGAARGWDEAEMRRRESFQDSLSSKKKRADYIIDNNGSLDQAAAQVAAVWQEIIGS
jgi:dephospho-CoA kinase